VSVAARTWAMNIDERMARAASRRLVSFHAGCRQRYRKGTSE